MAFFKKKSDLPQDKLSLPLEIDDGHWSRIYSHILIIISCLVSALIIIASVAPIHEIVVAEGQIIPAGDIVETQHLEGGIVASVNVIEGDFVKQGDVLMKIKAHDVDTKLTQSTAKRVSLGAERIRISALIDGKKPNFSEYKAKHTSIVRDQNALFSAEQKAHLAEIRAAELRIAQRISELDIAESETEKYKTELTLRERRLDILKGLLAKGLSTQQVVLDAQLALKDNELRYARAAGSLEVAQRKVSEAESALANVKATKRSEWIEALSQTEANIVDIDELLGNLEQKVRRQEILAPVTGIVQSLAAYNPGEVVKAGEVTAKIVPVSREIEAEVNVPPEHIGHISIGSEARVLLTAYDNETYGYANGNISVLSPTTNRNEKGEFFYTAKLKLDRQSLSFGQVQKPILPGMIAHAEIYTGTKSLMKYLLKPVYRSVGRAFSER